MAISELSRAQLNQEFRDGERPSGDDFASAWLSFLHKSDDGVKIDVNGNLELNRGVTIKDTPAGQAGTLRFNSGQLQYHDGTSFKSVSTGASGAFLPVGSGPSVAFGGGNVGIGTFGAAPTHKVDVILGNNITGTSDQQIKMGNLAVHNGSTGDGAYISNAAKIGDLDYALKQDSQGNTTINTANNTQLVFGQNGVSRFRILVSGAIELTPLTTFTINGHTSIGNPIAGKNLSVFGNINHTGTILGPSDSRLKKDIRPFKEGFEKLLDLDPVSFKYNGLGGTLDDDKEQIGLIAQDVQKVFPQLIHPQSRQLNSNDPKEIDLLTIDFRPLTFVIINAIKEIAARIDNLEKNTSNEKRKPKGSAGIIH